MKAQAAERQGLKPVEKAPAFMEKAFSRGNSHEEAAVATMMAQGWEITDQQREVIIPINSVCMVMGHLDGIGYPPGDVGRINPAPIIEIKSPNAYRMFREQMYERECSPLVGRYKWQISVYMTALVREAVFACLDEDYNILWHQIEQPFYDGDHIRERVEEIERLAREGLPKVCLPREFPCRYVYLHEDDVQLDHDSEIDELVDEYAEIQARSKELDDKGKRLRARIEQALGDRTAVTTAASRVTVATRRYKVLNKGRAKEAGINLSDYEEEKVSTYLRITKRGNGEGDEAE